MTHGKPDWGATAGSQTTYQLQDLAELAVRLGSIVSFDRLGEVIYFDDFEKSLPRYTQQTIGTAAAIAYDTSRARSGLRSLKMTAGSDDIAAAILNMRTADLVPSRIGQQVSFSIDDELAAFELLINHLDGADEWIARVKWEQATQHLLIVDHTASEVVVATGIDLDVSAIDWHTIKLVVDMEIHRYLRVKLDTHVFDLSSYALASAGVSAPPRIEWAVANFGRAGHNDVIYIDDLVLTQNEPA
jgi:hypothetical protein